MRDECSGGRGSERSAVEGIRGMEEREGLVGGGEHNITFVVAFAAAKPSFSAPPRGPHRETIKPRVMG